MVKPWQFFFEQDVDVGPLCVHQVDAKADGLDEGVFLGRSHVHLLIEHVKAGGDDLLEKVLVALDPRPVFYLAIWVLKIVGRHPFYQPRSGMVMGCKVPFFYCHDECHFT